MSPDSRKLWQIHLSTAIVLTFVAGTLLWANLQPEIAVSSEAACFGWPGTAFTKYGTDYSHIHFSGFLVDVFVGLAFLSATVLLCEGLLDRRSPRSEFEPGIAQQ